MKVRKEHNFNFFLTYVGIVLLELAIFTGNHAANPKVKVSTLAAMSSVHLICCYSLTIFFASYFERKNILKLSYLKLSLLGTSISLVSNFLYLVLGMHLSTIVNSPVKTILISLIQGSFWFPQVSILGSRLTKINEVLTKYEKRLIIKARVAFRRSNTFKILENRLSREIEEELRQICRKMLEKIASIDTSALSQVVKNEEAQKVLVRDELRRFSLQLENRGRKLEERTSFQNFLSSFKLLTKQYRTLYSQSTKSYPLPASVFIALMLFGIFPNMIRYLAISQIIFGTLVIAISIYILATVIRFLYTKNSPKASPFIFLILYLMGITPAFSQYLGDILYPGMRRDFPPLILYFSIPLLYYIMIRFAQILQPKVMGLVEDEALTLSPSLEKAISKVIDDELRQIISHNWAIYVHGKVLTKISAFSLRLNRATEVEDLDTFSLAMVQLQDFLKEPTVDRKHKIQECELEVSYRLEPWDGLVHISSEIDPSLRQWKSPRVIDVGEVLEEAISNSVRHGKSQRIWIVVTQLSDGTLQLILKDDSKIPLPEFQDRIGLGTKLFNLVSDGRWSLEHGESGTEFSLIMSVNEQS